MATGRLSRLISEDDRKRTKDYQKPLSAIQHRVGWSGSKACVLPCLSLVEDREMSTPM
jgi:hypothetical protein